MNNIKILILATLWAILPMVTTANSATDLIHKADSAYNSNDFVQAVSLYTEAIDTLGGSSDLYYNLGNSYYRTGQNGKAILMYERALRINPRNEEARTNLEFVNSRIVDRPGERGTLLSNAIDSLLDIATPNGWAWIAFTCFILTLGAIAMYYFSSIITLRKLGFFGGIVLILLTFLCIYLSIKATDRATADDEAIVTVPSTILSTVPHSPQNRSEEAMLLHDGTKIVILDSVMSEADSIPMMWYDAEIDNNHRAWIKSSDVERI